MSESISTDQVFTIIKFIKFSLQLLKRVNPINSFNVLNNVTGPFTIRVRILAAPFPTIAYLLKNSAT